MERRRGATANERDHIARRLAGGDNLILFPEGTSNDGNRVLPFKSALFAVAERDWMLIQNLVLLYGVIFIFVCLMRGMGGQFSARNHEAVEAASFYWHFVDVVWIALFATIYLIK